MEEKRGGGVCLLYAGITACIRSRLYISRKHAYIFAITSKLCGVHLQYNVNLLERTIAQLPRSICSLLVEFPFCDWKITVIV